MNDKLLETKELLFDKFGFEISNFEIEKESSKYCACRFEINKLKVLFRSAKTTPTKMGQFVTLWKRNGTKKIIEPFEITDNIDFFVISVKTETNFGQFVFPKSVLVEKGIITFINEGKRAIRVYPIWDLPESKQAQKTQKWQLDYFLNIPKNDTLDLNRVALLYHKNNIKIK
jgi:hypothetical protein